MAKIQKVKVDEKNIHCGHRARLLDAVVNSGLENLSEIQAMEFVLTYIFPRGDTNPLAHRLLAKFGDMASVMNADVNDLQSVEGIGLRAAQLITEFPEIFHYYSCCRLKKGLLLNNYRDIIDFCEDLLRFRNTEELYIVALDVKSKLLGYRALARGSINMVGITQNEITKFLNTFKPAYVFLTHNHPGGECYPSDKDIIANDRLKEMFAVLDVSFVDHYIVSGDGVYSIKEKRKLRDYVQL